MGIGDRQPSSEMSALSQSCTIAVLAALVGTAHGKATKYASSVRAPPVAASPARPASAFAAGGPTMPRVDERVTCPVPEEGIEHAVALMREGMLFRYTYPSGSVSPVTTCENALAAYTGHKYCVAVNSGATALYLSLRAAGVEPGDKVLCNAFTFGAVPSAIVHAGGDVVYVESGSDYCIDLDDLKATLAEHPDAKALMLSHMRGRVGQMDAIAQVCAEAGVTLLEDCAHSLGVRYGGVHTGHHGVACGVSAQSFKLLNSGEGGFVLTDDPEIAMRAAVLAGAYETNADKHKNLPEIEERFKSLAVELPNLSLRMSALTSAVLIPQVGSLDERIAKYGRRYDALAAKVQASPAASAALHVPDDLAEVFPVHDELLFTVRPEALARAGDGAVGQLQAACAARGLVMNLFGSASNARNFVNWKFAPHARSGPLPRTAELIKTSFGIRLPLQWSDDDILAIGDVLEFCAAEVFGAGGEAA